MIAAMMTTMIIERSESYISGNDSFRKQQKARM